MTKEEAIGVLEQFKGDWLIGEKATEVKQALSSLLEIVKRVDVDKIKNIGADLVEEYFPKGQCKERGQAIVLYARLLVKLVDYLENK